MAATTRMVYGCPQSVLVKTLIQAGSYLHRSKQIHTTALSKACLQRTKAHVLTSRGRLNVACIGQRQVSPTDRWFHGCNHSHVVKCVQTTKTLCNSAYSTILPSSSYLDNFSFSCKHNTWQRRAVFRSHILDCRKSTDQSESGAHAAPAQHSNRKFCENGRPEKKENIKTIPNLLTTLRMASAPLLGYMVLCEHFGVALGIFTFAGITDLLDGYIARNFANQTSALGSVMDPLADKLLVTILTVTLTSVGLIPLPLTGLIVFRDASLIAGGFYIRYKSLHPPITLSRYFDISHATVSLAPTFISKVNTVLQLSLVACSLAAPVFGFVDHISLQVLWWMTGATTFLSGADYLWSWKKHVTLLEKDQKDL